MTGRSIRLAALAALCAAVAVLAFLATRTSTQGGTEVQSPLLGQLAPSVTEQVLYPQHRDGAVLRTGALRGRVVVLTFFATWCGPCRAEAHDLEVFARREQAAHHATSVVAVLFDDQVSAGRQFAAAAGFTFPVLDDREGQLANLLDVTSPPVTVIVSPAQRVRDVLDGPVTTAQLTRLVAAART